MIASPDDESETAVDVHEHDAVLETVLGTFLDLRIEAEFDQLIILTASLNNAIDCLQLSSKLGENRVDDAIRGCTG